MRLIFLAFSTLMLAQCASSDSDRFQVGAASDALVIIGVAEHPEHRDPAYTMLWRRIDPHTGGFAEPDGDTVFDPSTNSDDSLRIRGIPGEFAVARLEPGVYGLGSVFAVIREGGVNYIAQGLIEGPERPGFELRPGEAVYLGIWELSIDGAEAAARPWRFEQDDMRSVVRRARAVSGEVRMREPTTVSAVCDPERVSRLSQRRIC